MRQSLLLLFLFFAALPSQAQRTASNPLGAQLNVQDAGTCSTTGSFAWQTLPTNAGTTTVNLAGTFSGTVTIRLSNNGGSSWTTNSTTSSVGTTSIATNGFTDVCADVTTFTSGVFQVTITTGIQQVQSVVSSSGGGITSPSSLTTFFNKFMGLAPEDYGAFGDAHWCWDANITSGQSTFQSLNSQTISTISASAGTATVTLSANMPTALIKGQPIVIAGVTNNTYNGSFTVSSVASGSQFNYVLGSSPASSSGGTASFSCATFSAADVGKVIEVQGAGAAGAVLHTTISGFTNATTVSLTANAGTTVTTGKFLWAHDDTGPIVTNSSNWCSGIANGTPTASGLKVHQGYLTRWYYIAQPCRIVNPNGSPGFGAGGFGSPEPFTSANAMEGMQILGTGGLTSGFAIATAGTFNWNCGAANTGALYTSLWNGSSLQDFGIIADNSAHNVTACTGVVGGLVQDNNGHDYTNAIEIENFHSTAGTLAAHVVSSNCFESKFSNMQLYNNDVNGSYGAGITGGAGSTFEQCIFDSMIWEGWKTTSQANVIFIGTSSNSGQGGIRIVNSRIIDSGTAGTGGELALGSTFSTLTNDCMVIENTAITSTVAGNYNIATNAAATGCLRMSNVTLTNTAASSASNLINDGGGMTISQTGGSWNCSATCANGITNATGGFIFAVDVANTSGRAGIAGSGSTSVATATQNAVAATTGWTGGGVWGSSALIFQGTQTLPTGTGACATITTNTGGAAGGQATCTGTTGASTFVITPGSTAAHGWVCFASDQTTAANTLRQSANNATTCTIAGTVNANDVLTFGAFAY